MLKIIGTYYCENHDEVEQEAANFKRTLKPDEAVLIVYPDIRLCGGLKQMVVTSYSNTYRVVADRIDPYTNPVAAQIESAGGGHPYD